MKTIKYISLILIGLLVFTSCEEDAPLTYSFKFKTDVEQEQKDTYINDSKEISYDITTEYKFDKVPMKIKLDTDKKGVFMLDNETLEVGKFYTLNQQKNTIKYIGLVQGRHHLTFHFENEHKEKSIKELDVDFINASIILKDFSVDKTETSRINDNINIIGTVLKLPKHTKTIYYKTWSSSPTGGLSTTNNNYIKYELSDDNQFKIGINTLKIGKYILKLQIKDEYGNESEVKEFQVNVSDKDYNIEERGDLTSIYQGQNSSLQIGVFETNATSETYQIRFTEFNGKIKFNGQTIVLGNWYKIDKNKLYATVVNSSVVGTTRLKYEIKNSYKSKDKTSHIVVKALNFTINQIGQIQVFQGEDVKLNVSISEESASNQTYQIRFTQYDGEIKLNGQNVSLQHWMTIDKKRASIVLHSEGTDSKVLMYQIKNDFVTNTKTSYINIKKTPFEITKVDKPKEDNYYLNKDFYVRMYLKTNSKVLKYKITSNNPEDINNISSTFNSINVVNNHIDFKFKPLSVGNYKLTFILKDKFDNEITETIEFKTRTKVTSELYVTHKIPIMKLIKTSDFGWFGDNIKIVKIYSDKIKFGFNLNYTVPNNKSIKKVIVKVSSYWQGGVQILPNYTKTFNVNAKSVNKKFEIVNQEETATLSDYEKNISFSPRPMTEPWRNFVKQVDFLKYMNTNPYIEIVVIHSDGYEDTIRSFINN